MRFWLAIGLGALLCFVAAGGCSRRRPNDLPTAATPEQALRELARVGGDAARLFDLLDQDSRWSVMTVHRDLRALCQLVRTHYPKDRQIRELQRCSAAETAREPRDLFVGQARGWGMLEGIDGLSGKEPVQGSGEQRSVTRAGAPALLLCRGGAGWGYCGLREKLDGLKLKTARDLASVQENAEAYKGH